MVVINDWGERREEKLRSESKKKKGKKFVCVYLYLKLYIYNRFSRLENKPLE